MGKERQGGAALERGKIAGIENGEYIVQSLDRDGIESPPLGTVKNESYQTGDRVYFFLFPDGTGKILCRI